MGLSPHTSQGEPLQLRYPSRISASTHGSGASPFHTSALPTSLNLAASVNPWLYDFSLGSLQLVYRTVQVDFLYFSCNSHLVLGWGEYNIHLLCRHLRSLQSNNFPPSLHEYVFLLYSANVVSHIDSFSNVKPTLYLSNEPLLGCDTLSFLYIAGFYILLMLQWTHRHHCKWVESTLRIKEFTSKQKNVSILVLPCLFQE